MGNSVFCSLDNEHTLDENSHGIKVRYSVEDIYDYYSNGNVRPLYLLVDAWIKIKALDPSNINSFYYIASYHGEPFHYRDQSSDNIYKYWGGYSQHGNILFPTWHRAYLLRLEKALQTIHPDVTLPYWDVTSVSTMQNGLPKIFTVKDFTFWYTTVQNPFLCFKLPYDLQNNTFISTNGSAGHLVHTTTRYPLSTVTGSEESIKQAELHNTLYSNYERNVKILNENIKQWLVGLHTLRADMLKGKPKYPLEKGTFWFYENALKAPNYTTFSNKLSASQWNIDNPNEFVTSIESAFHDIQLAIGGFDCNLANSFNPQPENITTNKSKDDLLNYSIECLPTTSQSDMGEKNTASFDPLYFFHLCNIDRIFYIWQKRHNSLNTLDVISNNYPGNNSNDCQGPTPDVDPNVLLTLDTPLRPFLKEHSNRYLTSKDVINITELGYIYSNGSLDIDTKDISTETDENDVRKGKYSTTSTLNLYGIIPDLFHGSILILAYAKVLKGKETESYYLGHYTIFNQKSSNIISKVDTNIPIQFSLQAVPTREISFASFNFKLYSRSNKISSELSFKVQTINIEFKNAKKVSVNNQKVYEVIISNPFKIKK